MDPVEQEKARRDERLAHWREEKHVLSEKFEAYMRGLSDKIPQLEAPLCPEEKERVVSCYSARVSGEPFMLAECSQEVKKFSQCIGIYHNQWLQTHLDLAEKKHAAASAS
ncbi:hypothetical protein DIPPA_19780 [Diplonema papillatum]|nr:hypothetical protein DIPPA_19780 [Diplonema papillatum]